MFRYCYVHKGIFGIKRPLLNLKKTGGICKRCVPIEKLKIELYELKKSIDRLNQLHP